MMIMLIADLCACILLLVRVQCGLSRDSTNSGIRHCELAVRPWMCHQLSLKLRFFNLQNRESSIHLAGLLCVMETIHCLNA